MEKKLYMTPDIEVMKLQTIGMLAASLDKTSEDVTDESEILGHDDEDFDW